MLILFQDDCVSHIAFNGFFAKVNQILKNNYTMISSNLNAIQLTAQNILRSKAFGASIWEKALLWFCAKQKYMGRIS